MIKIFARGISFITHPLFVLSYGLLLTMYTNPYLFGAGTWQSCYANNIGHVLSVFLMSFIFPAFATFMMRALRMIDSIHMHEKSDRTGPLIATIVCYTWLYVNLRWNGLLPEVFQIFCLGSVISLFIAFFMNVFMKISLHAIGMGGMIGMMVVLVRDENMVIINPVLGIFICIAIMAGLAGTARVLLDAHEPKEVLSGYLAGMVSMMIASIFI